MSLTSDAIDYFAATHDSLDIDLRSDTVTKPTPAMRWAIANASVGDDVFGDDPTVLALQKKSATLTGKEASLFVPSTTQSNLLALLTHCGRGDEYIAAQTSHIFRWEAGGGAVLGGISPQPLDCQSDGTLDLGVVQKAIKPDDCHFAKTKLLCIENTHGGKVLPMGYIDEATALAKSRSLSTHLDGARLCNAAVALGLPLERLARDFDSVSICLSKGLGAPVGGLLCGSKEFIAKACRWRKMVGGGMRQAGVLAAAGLYALEHNIERLAEDHQNAEAFGRGLLEITALAGKVLVHTNMVFVEVGPVAGAALPAFLASQGIYILGGSILRLVVHLDVSKAAVDIAVRAFSDFFALPSAEQQRLAQAAGGVSSKYT